MAVRAILKMGDPLLLKQADPVTEFDTPELHSLLQDMVDTMKVHHGAGIAAPQIGVSKQIVIFGGSKSPRYPDAELVPFTVLINPELTPLSDQMEDDWEGCLSVPGLRGKVPRYSQLRYQGVDQFGNVIDRIASGFHARVVQHEVDHLLGILYPMRIKDMTQFGFIESMFPGQDIVDD
jgi:peptide deformylase